MAKNLKSDASESSKASADTSFDPANLPQLPAGYEEVSGDLVGQWDPDNKGSPSCHFIPEYVNLSDSKLNRDRPSTLLVGKLVDRCLLVKDEAIVEGKPGDQIGVWITHGNKEALQWCGSKVFIYPTGTLDVGKPSPMKTFAVAKPKDATKKLARVVNDYRKESMHSPHFLNPRKPGVSKGGPAGPAVEETDLYL